MKQNAISLTRSIIMLAPMVLALPLAMDIYIPAVPKLASVFHVSAATMQMTLTAFMLASGIMQLVVGPLSDRYGRKSMSIVTIVIFALGAFLCARATSAESLIYYRLIEAVGSCGMLVICFAVVRDLYSGTKSAKAYSFLNGLMSFSPMFAPFIGSFLDVYFGWPSTFLILLVLAVLALFSMCFGLPETLAPELRRPVNKSLFREYFSILTTKQFFIYTLATAFGLSYLYLFCSISPYIIIRILHIPELHYGYYFSFMGISFFLGSFLSAFIVGKLGIFKTNILGFYLSLLGGLIMTVWFFVTGVTIDNFIWPMLLIGIGGTLSMGAGAAGAMEAYGEEAGTAAALSGAFRFFFGGVIGSIVISKHVESTLPLAIPAVIFSIIGLVMFMRYRKALLIE